MKVILPKHAGFCFGVKRALQEAVKATEQDTQPVFSLGPLIHNPQEVKRLAEEGIAVAESIEDIPAGGTLVIRSHGLAPEVVEEARRRGLNIVDATCPLVKNAQEYAQLLHDQGYTVVVIGDPNHPEIKSVTGYTEHEAIVINDESMVKKLPEMNRLGVILQTTLQLDLCQHIVSLLLPKARELKVFNTLCDATFKRQQEALEMAKKVDMMIVVGGRNSANTTHLAEICRSAGSITYHIEEASELSEDWFKNCKVVGVTAGASTPSWVLNEAVERLKKMTEGEEKG